MGSWLFWLIMSPFLVAFAWGVILLWVGGDHDGEWWM